MDSENVAQNKKNKKPFVVREIPAETFLDSRLRGSAHQVLGLLWSKADVRSGELRIGSHFFSQHELVRVAKKIGISERTFRNVLRLQLVPLGYVKELERDLIDHTDTAGRKRKIPGSQHYIVFKTSQEPHGQRIIRKAKPKKPRGEQVSTTGKNLPDEGNALPLGDSTSGKDLPDEENNLRPAKSTSGVDLPDNTYIKSPSSSAVGGDGFESESESIKHTGGSFHKSTTPENHPEPAAVNPEIETKKRELVQGFIMFLRQYQRENKLDDLRLHNNYEAFKESANILCDTFPEIQKLWKQVRDGVFPPKPKPTPELVPEIRNGDKSELWKRSRAFYRYAEKFGWTPPDERIYRGALLRHLRDTFHVNAPDKLSPEQFRIVWRRIEQGPPKPN
jgi:hypothetical protein